ncbi:hypothetical protein Rumeso_02922 [Rubellimicrobium mesophilum DSM 19309]|uniref:DUF2029 domain-containing protein n=1 Tax=Rubellimicrobium mesophilum DSM 19309 TaxID=442562 RepID=A0A017HM10_9RHOB|nr:glycosyltransferase family 87 protein [Rubellimicrobium mesophilum]EYD75512.1 hypothetical protein Rumeso_02922 [Rubellimicrobium mesophilum DSM 19309]
MHDTAPTLRPLVRLRPVTVAAATLVLAIYLGFTLLATTYRTLADGPKADFDIFWIVGKMVWAGTLPDAYSMDLFATRQIEVVGGQVWAPWTYPPQFNAVVALLALLPLGTAFALFNLVTLAAYLPILARLARGHVAAIMLTMLPIVAGDLIIGQNGLLTGALVGAYALLSLRGSALAGLPLGLMVIKPHLALGLGVAALLGRRWGTLAWAAGVVAGTSLLSTLAFGPAIWPAFLRGVAEAKGFLAEGKYHLNLMPSIYAALRSLGVAPGLAAAVQATVGLAGLAFVALATLRRWEPRRLLSAATLGSLLVSPYLQHYDLAILGIGLTLATGDLAAPAARRLFPAVLAGVWLIAFFINGYWTQTLAWARAQLGAPAVDGDPWALAGLVLLPLVVLVLAILWRAERDRRA